MGACARPVARLTNREPGSSLRLLDADAQQRPGRPAQQAPTCGVPECPCARHGHFGSRSRFGDGEQLDAPRDSRAAFCRSSSTTPRPLLPAPPPEPSAPKPAPRHLSFSRYSCIAKRDLVPVCINGPKMSEVKMQIELFVNVQVNFIFFLHSENVANVIYIYIYIYNSQISGWSNAVGTRNGGHGSGRRSAKLSKRKPKHVKIWSGCYLRTF